MRRLSIFAIFVIVCLNGFSQRSSDLKVGVGLPIFMGNVDNLYVRGFPTISVEKPFPFALGDAEGFSINPGAAFFYFKQHETIGNVEAWQTKDYRNLSANAYLKMLYNLKVKRRSEAFIYFGGIAGVHLYTQSKVTMENCGTSYDQECYSTEKKESGKDFFNTMYYGVLVGFQPNAKITNMLKPSFEFSYLPGFVSKKGVKTDAIQLSVLLGINY